MRKSGEWVGLDDARPYSPTATPTPLPPLVEYEGMEDGEIVHMRTDVPSNTYDIATSTVSTDMSITSTDDIDDDNEYVSVSIELFNQLLVMRNACTCGARSGQ